MEFRHDSLRDFSSSSTRFTHSREELEVLHVVRNDLCSIEPESIVNPLSHELKRRLRSEGVFSWHVEVINKADSLLLRVFRSVFVLGSSLEVTLNNLLSVE